MKYLVTGGAGFIGSAVVRAALAEGHGVINYDALTAAASLADIWDLEDDPNYTLVSADMCDRATLDETLDRYAPDVVVHCAAETLHAWPLDGRKRCVHTNVTGTVTLLDALHTHWSGQNKLSNGRLVSLVPADTPSSPDLSLATETLNVAHKMIETWADKFSVPVVRVKLDQVFGVGQRFGSPLRKAQEQIDCDLEKVQNWVDVSDAAEAILWASREPAGTYRAGGDLNFKPSEIAEFLTDAPSQSGEIVPNTAEFDYHCTNNQRAKLAAAIKWLEQTNQFKITPHSKSSGIGAVA